MNKLFTWSPSLQWALCIPCLPLHALFFTWKSLSLFLDQANLCYHFCKIQLTVDPLIHLSLINWTNVYHAYTKSLVHGIQESQSSVENTCYNKALHIFLQPFLHSHTDVVASFYHHRTWCKKKEYFISLRTIISMYKNFSPN